MKRRTYFVFLNKDQREQAFDFLTGMKIPFQANLEQAGKVLWLSVTAKKAINSDLDLYLNFVKYFSSVS